MKKLLIILALFSLAPFAHATTVNLPIASPQTSACVRYSINPGVWSDAFAGLNYNLVAASCSTSDAFFETSVNSGFKQQTEMLITIDTSSIPSGAVISAASLALTSDGAARDDNSLNAVLIPTTLTSLTTTAQAARANWTTGTSLGSAAAAPWLVGGATVTITLNAAGISNITKGGTTFMGLVSSDYISQTIPTGINSYSLFGATGTTPPVFSVTYTLPATGSPSIVGLLRALWW